MPNTTYNFNELKVLDKFNPKETLAQIDALLYNCRKGKVSEDIFNEINVETFKYIKSCLIFYI